MLLDGYKSRVGGVSYDMFRDRPRRAYVPVTGKHEHRPAKALKRFTGVYGVALERREPIGETNE